MTGLAEWGWVVWLGVGSVGMGVVLWLRGRRAAACRRFREASHDLWAALSKMFDPSDRRALARLVEETPWPDEWWGNETNRKAVKDLARSVFQANGHAAEVAHRELRQMVEFWGKNRGRWGLRYFLGGDSRDYHHETLKLHWYLSASDSRNGKTSHHSPVFEPIRTLRELLGRGETRGSPEL